MPPSKTDSVRPRRSPKDGRSSPTTGSYFLSLELENVRCFSERQTLDLSDGHGRPARWTILLGENGTGKTTILQLLAIMSRSEPVQHGDLRTARSRGLSRAFQSMFDSLNRDAEGPAARLRYEIARRAALADGRSEPERQPYELDLSPNVIFDRLIERHNQPEPLPTCFAYSVARRPGGIPSLPLQEYVDSADGLFLQDSMLKDAESWLLRLDYAASKTSRLQERQRQRLETARSLLIRILPDVNDIRFDPSSGVWPEPRVEFETPYGWVPMRQLGYGYRSMIAWVVDLAARMFECYPDSTNPLAEPAVVLVDEIDLHLHPKWQREVIGHLTEWFPNTQFIVTAHSPLIVQAAVGANLALLKREGDHVVIENDPETIRGWRVDQILTSDLFGLETARPPEVEKDLLRRKALLTKPRLTKAEREELSEIEGRIGPLPSDESFEQAKTMALIQESIEFLKKSRGVNP